MQLNELLEDAEVFSALAVGYHRTRNLKQLNAIGDSGFKAGRGNMYGTGIYLTYSFDDQQDEYMTEHYGPFVVRCKVNLSEFVIFDPDIAAKVYGARAGLDQQLQSFGIATTDPEIAEILRRHPQITAVEGVTSTLARRFAIWLVPRMSKLGKPVKGLVFSGEKDGRVIVAYDPARVVPFAWARVIKLDKTREQVKWNKIAMPPLKVAAGAAMPEFERLMRFFRQSGFTTTSKGPVGARMVGIRNGIYVTLIISNGRIEAWATRRNPEQMARKLPGYTRLGHRLIYQETSERFAVGQIAQTIYDECDAFQARPAQHIEFTEALLHRLVAPETNIQQEQVRGPEFQRDQIKLHAGPISVELDHPYFEYTSGRIWIAAKPLPIETGFNDGSRSGPPNLDKAYQSVLDMAGMLPRPGRIHFELPDSLNPHFAADLRATIMATA